MSGKHIQSPHSHSDLPSYPSPPNYGSNWAYKIADFLFLAYISFIIAFTVLEWIPYILIMPVRLTPCPPLVGHTGIILNKEADFVFLPYISFTIAFTALECINDHRKQNKALHFFLSCKCINLHTFYYTFTSCCWFFFSKTFFYFYTICISPLGTLCFCEHKYCSS